MAKSRVALVKGDNRYENIARALQLIEDQIDLSDKEQVFIKVNFVSTTRQLAATHVDAVRALLDFLRERYKGPIIIGEGAALSDTLEGYRNFGYLPLAEEYDIILMDLNRDHWVEVELYDRLLRPMKLRVARTVVESDFRIAIGPPKTHDTVVVTLSLKNIAVGSLIRNQGSGSAILATARRFVPARIAKSPLIERLKAPVASTMARSDKVALHQGYHGINLNLYHLARIVAPHLSVIDGFEAMEGEGPVSGDPVPWRIAVASTDFLAADVLTTHLMGFNVEEIGYLYYCKIKGLGTGDIKQMEIVGNISLKEARRPFRPHPTYKEQLNWKIPDVEKYL